MKMTIATLAKQDPQAAFCTASRRYDNIDPASAASRLVDVVWLAFDADLFIVVRHGDQVMKLDLRTDVTMQGDVVHLGPLAIDLSTSSLTIPEDSIGYADFLLDGVPLRLMYDGRYVDATHAFTHDLAWQVLRMWDGTVATIDVTRGDHKVSLGRDDVRLYPVGSRFAVRLGSLMLVRPDRGPAWNFEKGLLDDIDLDGRRVQIEVVTAPGRMFSPPPEMGMY